MKNSSKLHPHAFIRSQGAQGPHAPAGDMDVRASIGYVVEKEPQ